MQIINEVIQPYGIKLLFCLYNAEIPLERHNCDPCVDILEKIESDALRYQVQEFLYERESSSKGFTLFNTNSMQIICLIAAESSDFLASGDAVAISNHVQQTFVHELAHVCIDVFHMIDCDVDIKTCEPFAYLYGYLFNLLDPTAVDEGRFTLEYNSKIHEAMVQANEEAKVQKEAMEAYEKSKEEKAPETTELPPLTEILPIDDESKPEDTTKAEPPSEKEYPNKRKNKGLLGPTVLETTGVIDCGICDIDRDLFRKDFQSLFTAINQIHNIRCALINDFYFTVTPVEDFNLTLFEISAKVIEKDGGPAMDEKRLLIDINYDKIREYIKDYGVRRKYVHRILELIIESCMVKDEKAVASLEEIKKSI